MSRSSLGPMVPAAVLILLGALFLLSNFGVADAGQIIGDWWPLAVIALGLWWLAVEPRWLGAAAVVLGLIFLGESLGVSPGIGQLWPLILIAIGLLILVQRRRGVPMMTPAQVESGDALSMATFLGGSDRVVTSQSFRGGSVTAVMGGANLDLRRAQLAHSRAVLSVTAVMGGVEIKTPDTWVVQLNGTPVLGGVEDSRTAHPVEGPVLVVNATAVMGGVEVKG